MLNYNDYMDFLFLWNVVDLVVASNSWFCKS